jgi:hypothetical protein
MQENSCQEKFGSAGNPAATGGRGDISLPARPTYARRSAGFA